MSTSCAYLTSAKSSRIEPFDTIASRYDSIFTRSSIGEAQRAQITPHLNALFPAGSRVLELNCGTGEDAIALGRRGVDVTAFDASPKMIEVATSRLHCESPLASVRFGVLRNECLHTVQDRFDGVFSNFAGLNCSRNWSSIGAELFRLIRPGGHLALCIMGRACLWEMLVFLLQGNMSRAVRRLFRQNTASIDGTSTNVFYHSANDAEAAFTGFQLIGWRGIGVFVPPSYCESWMHRRRRLLSLLARLDERFSHLPLIRQFGDHIFLHFARNYE